MKENRNPGKSFIQRCLLHTYGKALRRIIGFKPWCLEDRSSIKPKELNCSRVGSGRDGKFNLDRLRLRCWSEHPGGVRMGTW